MLPRIRIEGTQTSGRLELHLYYWRRKAKHSYVDVYNKVVTADYFKYSKIKMDLGFICRFQRVKKCVQYKAAYIFAGQEDYCDIQRKLLARRTGRKLVRFDPYEGSNSSTLTVSDFEGL